jgi:hypothetical protein
MLLDAFAATWRGKIMMHVFSVKRSHLLLFFGSVLLFAPVIALFEIAIEGPWGWAEGAYNFGNEVNRGEERPFTWYHQFLNLLYLMILHFFFWKGEKWDGFLKAAGITLKCFSWMFGCWVVEDFLWFAMNPFYGLSRFSPEYIWWHKTWFLGVPYHYWILAPLSILFYLLSYRPTGRSFDLSKT